MRYTFHVNGIATLKDLVLSEWAIALVINRYDQVFKPASGDSVFRGVTIEDVSVVMQSIGVLEHRKPGVRGKQTAFINPQREALVFLDKEFCGCGGLNRTLIASRRCGRGGRGRQRREREVGVGIE